MPPYPTNVEDNYIFTDETKYIEHLREIVREVSHELVEDKKTIRYLLDERKSLKCLLNAYAKAGLVEEAQLTQTKLKVNKKCLDLLEEYQLSNKELHRIYSSILGKHIREQRNTK